MAHVFANLPVTAAPPLFADRREAGRLLAARLGCAAPDPGGEPNGASPALASLRPLVLALPRGLALSGTGVTVATTVPGAWSIPRRPRFLALAYPAQGRFGLLLRRLVLAVAPRAARAVLMAAFAARNADHALHSARAAWLPAQPGRRAAAQAGRYPRVRAAHRG